MRKYSRTFLMRFQNESDSTSIQDLPDVLAIIKTLEGTSTGMMGGNSVPTRSPRHARNGNLISVKRGLLGTCLPATIREIIKTIIMVIMKSDQKKMTFNDIRRALTHENVSFEDRDDLVKLITVLNREVFHLTQEKNEEWVTPKSNMRICANYTKYDRHVCWECKELHICKFHLVGTCHTEVCMFGHHLSGEHNQNVLRDHYLEYISEDDVRFIAKQIYSRNETTVPIVCMYYLYPSKCKKQRDCSFLHICREYLRGTCFSGTYNCDRSHDLASGRNRFILNSLGLSPEIYEERVIRELVYKMMEQFQSNVLPARITGSGSATFSKMELTASPKREEVPSNKDSLNRTTLGSDTEQHAPECIAEFSVKRDQAMANVEAEPLEPDGILAMHNSYISQKTSSKTGNETTSKESEIENHLVSDPERNTQLRIRLTGSTLTYSTGSHWTTMTKENQSSLEELFYNIVARASVEHTQLS